MKDEYDGGFGWVGPRQRFHQRALSLGDAEGNEFFVGGPTEGNAGYNTLDHAVFQRLIDTVWDAKRQRIFGIRGVFAEGNEFYPSSFLHDRSHVQIAVLDQSIIQKLTLEDGAALEEKLKNLVSSAPGKVVSYS